MLLLGPLAKSVFASRLPSVVCVDFVAFVASIADVHVAVAVAVDAQ